MLVATSFLPLKFTVAICKCCCKLSP